MRLTDRTKKLAVEEILNRTKQLITEEVFSKEDFVRFIIARDDELVVPPTLKKDPWVHLDVGYRMPQKIPDLTTNDWGIHATLSFAGVPFQCAIPWRSVRAILGPMIEVAWAPGPGETEPAAPDPGGDRPQLRLVSDEGGDTEP